MKLSLHSVTSLFAIIALGLVVGCADSEDDASPAAETGDDAEVIKASKVSIDEGDNGKTVSMAKAGSLVLKLPGNASTGYSWKVVSTDRTFGYPEESSDFQPGGPVGGGSMMSFTWKKNPLLQSGESHTVKMEYKRSWETGAPAKTFTFTVKVK